MRNWDINKTNIIDFVASHYKDVFAPIYEYIKNIEEQKATKFYIDFDYKRKQVSIVGNGTSIDCQELDRIVYNCFNSIKDARHFGAGILSFSSLATKVVLISKYKDNFFIIDCDRRLQYGSESDNAREMYNDELKTYAVAVGHLKSLRQGTAYVLSEIGTCINKPVVFSFTNMAEVFEKTKFVKWIQENDSPNLHRFNYILKAGDTKPSKIKAKLGKGKKIAFIIPSQECPVEKDKHRDEFELNGHRYSLKINFDLWLGRAHEDPIKVCENYQNFLNFDEMLGSSRKIPVNSIFRKHPLTKFLTGWINLNIKPLDAGPAATIYNGARNAILVENNFGDCLANLLICADIDFLQPIVKEYNSTHIDRKNTIRSENLNRTIGEIITANREAYSWLEMNMNIVPTRIVTCPNPKCQLASEPIKVNENIQIKTITKILEYSTYYVCSKCGRKWDKRIYIKSNDPPITPPIYRPPVPHDPEHPEKDTHLRKKSHGLGYTCEVMGFGNIDDRPWRIAPPTGIEINSDHLDYKKAEEKTKKRHCMVNYLAYYEALMAITGILEHSLRNEQNTKNALKISTNQAQILMKWFLLRT